MEDPQWEERSCVHNGPPLPAQMTCPPGSADRGWRLLVQILSRDSVVWARQQRADGPAEA